MFHHHTSSRSSQDNLELNLLGKDQRQSKINIYRTQYPRPNERSSHEIQPQPFYEQIELKDMNKYENYSTQAIKDKHLTESILTESSSNLKIIGILLFVLLIVLTPAEVFVMVYFHPSIGFRHIMLDILAAQLISFVVLWSLKEIQRMNLKKQLFNQYRRKINTSIVNRPWLLIFCVGICTLFWQISYVLAISHDISINLVLFYMFLMPYVTVSLLHQDFEGKITKIAIFVTLLYSLGIIIPVFPWLVVGSVCSLLLSYFYLKLMVSLYLEYIVKVLLFIVFLFLFHSEDQAEYQISRIFVVLLLSLGVLMCRFVNSKYLRQQLYRYYYTDAQLNCVFLLTVIGIAFLEEELSLWLIISCLVLCLITYKVGTDKMQVIMNE